MAINTTNDEIKSMKRFLILFLLFLMGVIRAENINWQNVSQIPLFHEGRVKPLDSVARGVLMQIHGKQTFEKKSAVKWFVAVILEPLSSLDQKIFFVSHPDIIEMINETTDQTYFSFFDLVQHLEKLRELLDPSNSAHESEAFIDGIKNLLQQVNLYQGLCNSIIVWDSEDIKNEIIEKKRLALFQHIMPIQREHKNNLKMMNRRYIVLDQAACFFPILDNGGHWNSLGENYLAIDHIKNPSISVNRWIRLVSAFQQGHVELFNQAVTGLIEEAREDSHKHYQKNLFEFLLNTIDPFYWTMVLYICVVIAGILTWIIKNTTLKSFSFILLVIAFGLHTLGLFMRMYVHGRPPVTSIYSSAIFVGYIATLLCLCLEWRQKNGVALVSAGFIGFCTQLIAHHLALGGDTLEVMSAVLDSNFLLSTHVVTISIGYSSTLVAGMIANIYIIRKFFKRKLDQSQVTSTLYGMTCFSLLMTFTGTVLGGVWADQAWGRFWGWDPKENGALLIVLWCLLIMHMSLGRLISKHTFICLVALGNIGTMLSWFGVNLLGIGLHSYGFTSATFLWLFAFIFVQIILVVISLILGKVEFKMISKG